MSTEIKTKTNIDCMDEFLTELFLPIEEDDNEDECVEEYTDKEIDIINFYLSITEE